jgi:hypothetical protein
MNTMTENFWAADGEINDILEMEDDDRLDYLGMRYRELENAEQEHPAWVPLGVLYWREEGVTKTRSLARKLRVPYEDVRAAKRHIEALRAELGLDQPAAQRAHADLPANDNGLTPELTLEIARCQETGLSDPEDIASALGLPADAVQPALNDLRRSARQG